MIRIVPLLAAAFLALAAAPSHAQNAGKKGTDDKASARNAATNGSSKIGDFGDWGAFRRPGTKECFVLSQPVARAPKGLNRDPAYLFITFRPDSGVKNEVAMMTGYAVAETAQPVASIGASSFGLISSDGKAWLQNASEEGQFVQQARAGAQLVVKGTSKRGNALTDTYSLKGLGLAIDAAQKGCR
jgi:hypothetical protein